jgi:four helix bundle protein
MNKEEILKRTKAFAIRVVKAVNTLPTNRAADILGRQLLRSGTSVGANYRAAVRAKSNSDFVNKLKIVEEECDESIYWMELLVESSLFAEKQLAALRQEANEILAITVASIKTARKNQQA